VAEARRIDRGALALGAALAAALAGGAALALGPLGGRVADARAALRLHVERADAWRRERAGFREIEGPERDGWAAAWAALAAPLQPSGDEAALLAGAGAFFERPGVARLEVSRAGAGEAPVERSLVSPLDGATLLVRETPLEVRFHATYAALRELVRRIEDGEIPARIEALEIARETPGVAVRLRVAYFARAGAGS
jgi:hypothetical protein